MGNDGIATISGAYAHDGVILEMRPRVRGRRAVGLHGSRLGEFGAEVSVRVSVD